jgi:diguanylate cyclase (GGDEF)-like protein/putative nucleotidyltransferase with HDIG domain
MAWAISFYANTPVNFQFFIYLVCAILSSRLKVGLPGIVGTVSVNYIFILVSAIELSLSQTMSIACIGTLAQCLLHSKVRPKRVQLIFNFYNSSICAWGSYIAFHSSPLSAIDDSLAIRLFVTAVAYFFVNTVTIAMIIGLTERKKPHRVWCENFFWTSPHYLLGAGMAGLIHYLNERFGWQYALFVVPGAYLLYRSYQLYLGRLEEEKRHVSEVADLHLRTIEALSLAIEAKDQTTHDHLKRVQVYATEIAKEMGLSQDEVRAVEAGALLHDIGKLAVPEYILSKPGRLTADEFEKIKVHPAVGAEILSCVGFPYPVVPVVRSHHEKWDGSGYPDGLKGEEIPIGARILSVVDCMDALASDRQYRRAAPLDQAVQEVKMGAGTSFDPKVVEILVRRYTEFEQRTMSTPLRSIKLAAQMKVERGGEPAAGLAPAQGCDRSALAETGIEFITSISAARQEFQLLHEITTDLGSSLSVEDTCTLLATRLKRLIPYHAIAIYALTGDKLVPQFTAGDDARLFASLEIPIGQGLSGWVAENVKPILNGNPAVEPGYLNDPATFSLLRSAISVPLEGLTGNVGALTLYHREANAFTRDQLRVLLAVSAKTGLTIENACQFREAQTSASSDALTGLPNIHALYRYLDGEMAHAKRSGSPLALAVIDLDGFKEVNDRFGHLNGNRVLKLIAEGLASNCRHTDFAARLGGDEFVVVLPGSSQQTAATRLSLLEGMVEQASLAVCGEEVVGISLGTAFYPDDGDNAEDLLGVADRRMYRVKQRHHASRSLRALREHISERDLALVQ